MKIKLFVATITLSLLFSGILVAVGGETTDGRDEVKESIESEPEPMGLIDSAWPSFGRDRRNTGKSPYNTSYIDGTEEWNYTIGGYLREAPSIADDGTIYVGSSDEHLYAMNPNGTEKWNVYLYGTMFSSPAIAPDGTIYVCVGTGLYGHNYLWSVNPNGTWEWWFPSNDLMWTSPTIGSDGTIYAGSRDNNLYAVDQDGEEIWSFDTSGSISSSPALADDGTIYIGSMGGELYAVNPDGTEKWNITIGSIESVPAVGDDGTIYVGTIDNHLYAVNPDGTERWNFTTGGDVRSSPAIGEDGTIYVGSYDNNLYALNPDGTERWNFTTGDNIYPSPAIGGDGTIYLASQDNYIYAVNPDGTEKWNFEADDDMGSPAIGEDGTVYIGSRDSNLYALTGEHTLNIEEPDGEGTVKLDSVEITEWPYEEKYLHDTEIELQAEPEEHWYFVEWAGIDESEESVNITMDEDKEITPVFEEHTYTLDVTVEGEGEVHINPEEDYYDPGTEVTLSTEPDEDWYFVNWTGDYEVGDREITIIMDDDKTLTANFDEVGEGEQVLTINVDGEGTTDPKPGDHIYEEGEEVDLEAIADASWVFKEWTGETGRIDDTGSNDTFIIMDDDYTITAEFDAIADVNVTVEDTDQEPITDATVELDGDAPDSETDGTYIFENVEQGSYTLSVSHDDYVGPEDRTVEIEAEDAGETLTEAFTLDALADVSGTVEDTAEDPIEGATVELNGDQVTTDAQGFYEFEEIEEGSYTLSVSHDDYVDPEDRTVEIEAEDAGETLTEAFTLDAEDGSISGTVYDHDDSAYEGVTVNLYEGDDLTQDSIQDVSTGADGGYEFTGLTAEETLYTVEVVEEGYLDDTQEVTLSPGEDAEEIDFTLEAEDGSISGTVTYDETGLQNITVNLYEDENADPETATVIDTVQTDAEGDYTFESVDIGDYTVEATDPDYVDEIQNVTVSAGEDITDVDFSLETVEKDGVANFKVEITDYDNEVIKKEEITVEYTVTNTGDEEGTQDIVFSIDGDKEDSVEGITLDAEEERSGQFTWETEEEGEYTLEIATEDDDHSVDVTVNPYPDDEAFFVVEITDQEVDGNELRIEYTATNEGGEKGTQDIKFLINGEEIAEENVELEPDESFTGNFTHLIEEAGEYECEVQSEYGTEDSVKQTVEEDYGPEDEDPSYLREYGWLIALLVIGIVVAVGFLIMRGKGGALTSQSEEEMEEEYGEEEMFDEPEETEEELLEEEPEDEL